MATKVIILGGEEIKKQIVFKQYLNGNNISIENSRNIPGDYQNVELLCRDYNTSRMDLMFAYNDNRSIGYLYLGHFNDGVV